MLQGGTTAVLGVLAGTSAGLTGRTIARLAGLSHAGAGKVLTQLVEHGMVLAEPVGAANAYRLNREHLLVGPALEIVLRPEPVAVDDPAWRSQLDDTASQVQRWTGNPPSWVEFDIATFTRMITSSDPMIGDLRRDAHWLIAPTPPVRSAFARPVWSA